MFLDAADMKQFPKCTQVLQHLEVTLRGRPKVLNAFLRACMADDQGQPPRVAEGIARSRALRWGTGPRIDVLQGTIRAPAGGQIVDACGFHNTFGNFNQLEVTSVWFDGVEFGSNADLVKNIERLTITVLHEAVHWVRQEAGATDDIRTGGKYKGGSSYEAGGWFETEALGRRVCTPDELSDAILSRQF
jgi:hypothetical protein